MNNQIQNDACFKCREKEMLNRSRVSFWIMKNYYESNSCLFCTQCDVQNSDTRVEMDGEFSWHSFFFQSGIQLCNLLTF